MNNNFILKWISEGLMNEYKKNIFIPVLCIEVILVFVSIFYGIVEHSVFLFIAGLILFFISIIHNILYDFSFSKNVEKKYNNLLKDQVKLNEIISKVLEINGYEFQNFNKMIEIICNEGKKSTEEGMEEFIEREKIEIIKNELIKYINMGLNNENINYEIENDIKTKVIEKIKKDEIEIKNRIISNQKNKIKQSLSNIKKTNDTLKVEEVIEKSYKEVKRYNIKA